MTTLILITLCGFLFYLFNELEDKSVRSRWRGKYKDFLNENPGWKRKWKLDTHGSLLPVEKKWYYFNIYPEHKERFPYSSTIFVFLTDGEHLFQWLKFRMIEVAFLLIGWKFLVSFEIGIILSSFIKEKFFQKLDK